MSSEYSSIASCDDEFNLIWKIINEDLEKQYDDSKGQEYNSLIKIKKSDGGSFNVNIPGTGDEYFILQKYKVTDKMKVPSDQRWTTNTLSLKITLNSKNKKDEALLRGFNNIIHMSMGKFMSNSEKQIISYK